jgi:serine/threonine protein phosphatase PrpC
MSNSEAVNYVLDYCYDMNTNKRINNNIDIADKLADYALRKGSTDNVTIIVAFF